MSVHGVVIRAAMPADVAAIVDFGAQHVRVHYVPLIGADAADGQVRNWWNAAYLDTAVAGGGVVVAELDGRLVGELIRQRPPSAERVFIEHVAANERAGAFYEREGFGVDRIEPSADGDPRLAQVWRVRRKGHTRMTVGPPASSMASKSSS